MYVAIGGMQLKRWTGFFKIIVPTMKVLRAAKGSDGCHHADTFKSGDVFFAVSVWETQEQMQTFATSGLHGRLTSVAMDQMALFYNYSLELGAVPSRSEAAALWKAAIAERGGMGRVGSYKT